MYTCITKSFSYIAFLFSYSFLFLIYIILYINKLNIIIYYIGHKPEICIFRSQGRQIACDVSADLERCAMY